jgi:hypothetical protein
VLGGEERVGSRLLCVRRDRGNRDRNNQSECKPCCSHHDHLFNATHLTDATYLTHPTYLPCALVVVVFAVARFKPSSAIRRFGIRDND